MNAHPKLAATFRRRWLALALVLCTSLTATAAKEQSSTAIGSLTYGGSPTITINAGKSFPMTFRLTTNFVSSGITYFLKCPQGSNFFRIVSIDETSWPFLNPFVAAIRPLPVPLGDLLPASADLGPSSVDQLVPPGNYTVATLNVFVLPTTPAGQYTIIIDRGIVTDRTGGSFNDVPISAGPMTINVIR
jgi:hypothetical protein